MKRISVFLSLLLLVGLTACSAHSDQKNFEKLHEAYRDRGTSVEGYEVTDVEEFDGLKFFSVRVCLNTDDAVILDDYMWFEANVMLFPDEEQADAAYEQNQQSGLGGTCLRKGNILIYWMAEDPFADLYREVFTNQLGQ